MNELLFGEINVGHTESFSKEITIEIENKFREISGDVNPMHIDDDFANELSGGRYTKHVSFGMLTASLLSTLAGVYLPGKYSLIHSIDDIRFKKPVYVGDVLKVTGVVTSKQCGLNLIVIDVVIRNQNNVVVLKSTMKVLVQK